MTFNTVNATDVVAKVINELRRTGLTYFPINSKGRAIAQVISREVQNSQEFFDTNFNKAFSKYAKGSLLEALCSVFGLVREQATKAEAHIWELNHRFYVESGNFGDLNGGVAFTIPAGTVVFTDTTSSLDDAIEYVLASPAVCAPSSTEIYCNIEASKEGRLSNVGSNTLTNHDFIGYTTYLTEGLKCKNTYAIIGGQDRQGDEELRFALSIAATAAEASNHTALRFGLLQVPGLVDSKIIRWWGGIGTSGIFVVGQGNEAPPSMLLHAQQIIDEKGPNAMKGVVYSPPQVGVSFITRVNMSEEITANEESEIQVALLDVIQNYILSVRIGGPLDLRTLINRMYRVDSRIVSFGSNPSDTPFDELYIYRTSTSSGERVRSEWLDTDEITPLEHEVIIMENSITAPFQFTWEVYE